MPIGLPQIGLLADRLKVDEIRLAASGDRDDVIHVEGLDLRGAPANVTPTPIRRRWRPIRPDVLGTRCLSTPKPQQFRIAPNGRFPRGRPAI